MFWYHGLIFRHMNIIDAGYCETRLAQSLDLYIGHNGNSMGPDQWKTWKSWTPEHYGMTMGPA